MSLPPQSIAPAEASVDEAVAHRRRVLAALGKGAAAAGLVGAPLASHATRSYVLRNETLVPPGNGYCSVSGFQSAAISVAPGQTLTTCVGLKPSALIESGTFNYADATTGSNSGNARQVAGLTAAFASLTPPVTLSSTNANTLIAGGTVGIGTTIYWQTLRTGSGGTIQWVRASSLFPTSVIQALAFFGVMMGVSLSPDVHVLRVLFNNSDDSFAAAAYLSAAKDDNAVSNLQEGGRIPLDANYMAKQYRDNRAGAIKFFRALCTASSW